MNLNRWGNNPTFWRTSRQQCRWKHEIFLFIFIIIFLIPMHFDMKTTLISDGTDEVVCETFCCCFRSFTNAQKCTSVQGVMNFFFVYFQPTVCKNGVFNIEIWYLNWFCSTRCWLVVESFHLCAWPCHRCQSKIEEFEIDHFFPLFKLSFTIGPLNFGTSFNNWTELNRYKKKINFSRFTLSLCLPSFSLLNSFKLLCDFFAQIRSKVVVIFGWEPRKSVIPFAHKTIYLTIRTKFFFGELSHTVCLIFLFPQISCQSNTQYTVRAQTNEKAIVKLKILFD